MNAHLGYAVAGWIFLTGLYGVCSSRNFIHLVMCLAVTQSSTYILLLTIGYQNGATAPVFNDIGLAVPAVDPIVQAMVLTDIVVEVTVMGVLLALAIQLFERYGTLDMDKLQELRG